MQVVTACRSQHAEFCTCCDKGVCSTLTTLSTWLIVVWWMLWSFVQYFTDLPSLAYPRPCCSCYFMCKQDETSLLVASFSSGLDCLQRGVIVGFLPKWCWYDTLLLFWPGARTCAWNHMACVYNFINMLQYDYICLCNVKYWCVLLVAFQITRKFFASSCLSFFGRF
jgi:hypothetical protein